MIEYEIDANTAARINANNYDIADILAIARGSDVLDQVEMHPALPGEGGNPIDAA